MRWAILTSLTFYGLCARPFETLQLQRLGISGGGCAFAAIKSSGEVVAWGDPERGGDTVVTWGIDDSEDEEEEEEAEESEESEPHPDDYSVQDML